MDKLRQASPEQLAGETFVFEDKRIPEMLFRYRARNYPETLSPAERAQWEEFRFQYLTDPEAGASITLEEYQATIARLGESAEPGQRAILDDLLAYGDALLAE